MQKSSNAAEYVTPREESTEDLIVAAMNPFTAGLPCMFAPDVKPTGKVYSFQTADLYRIEKGKIAEH